MPRFTSAALIIGSALALVGCSTAGSYGYGLPRVAVVYPAYGYEYGYRPRGYDYGYFRPGYRVAPRGYWRGGPGPRWGGRYGGRHGYRH